MCKILGRVFSVTIILSLVGQHCGNKECAMEFMHNQAASVPNNYHLSQSVCVHRTQVVIKPFKTRIYNYNPPTIFKSICLRCTACLVIAHEINKTVNDLQLRVRDPDVEMRNLEDSLQSLCRNGFVEFDLTNGVEYDHSITKSAVLRDTRNTVGQWRAKLREMCSTYLEYINTMIFYNYLLKKPFDISNFLCGGEGILRDCHNVNVRTPQLKKEDTESDICTYINNL